jgi:DNA polymerase elongation subunit (family B)
MRFYTNVQVAGNNLLVREYDKGTRKQYKLPYQPTLFVPSNKPTKHKTLDGKYVAPIKPGGIRETRDWVKQYADVEGFQISGYQNYTYCYISDEYPGRVEYEKNRLVIANLDIEVGSENGFPDPDKADEVLTAITFKAKGKYFVFGCQPFDASAYSNLEYVHCKDEYEMCRLFLDIWDSVAPDILTGWNIQFFDIPYLYNRICKVMGEKDAKRLSPWRIVGERKVTLMGRTLYTYDLPGISVLDYIELYKKFTYTNQESYRLDYICHVELGERKLDYSEVETLHQLYKTDFQKYIEYNIRDVELVDKLEEKMKLIEMVIGLAYDAKVNINDVFSQVRMWDTLIFNHLREKHIVLPDKKSVSKNDKYEGAYVKPPHVGQHEWVMSFDLNSLYPHLIMQYNLSPETLIPDERIDVNVDKLLNQEVDLSHLNGKTVTPNGSVFRTDTQGFLPEMMDQLYADRKRYKKLMLEAQSKLQSETNAEKRRELEYQVSTYNNTQMAKKIQLNSAYGAIGNQYFRHYDLRIAEGITTAGQLSIRWIEKYINEYMNKLLETDNEDFVVAIDTDSVYIRFDGLVNKVFADRNDLSQDEFKNKVVSFLDKVASQKIEPFIDKSYQTLASYVNAFDQKMFMKRETIADKAIWTAKKRYIMNAWDVEGVRYDEPKLKIMGIEAVKSSTPEVCRNKIKEALKLIMQGTEKEVQSFISNFKTEFFKLPPEDISFPRGVNNLSKYTSSVTVYTKGTPMHVRGALVYNDMIKKNSLDRRYPIVQEGEKIKFCYLKEPNPSMQNTIAFPSSLPRDLNLHNYIDYETQFAKAYLEPLQTILDAIGWSAEQKGVSLEDFWT